MLRSGSALGGAIRLSTVTGFVRRGVVGKALPVGRTLAGHLLYFTSSSEGAWREQSRPATRKPFG
jgi:hypothetical protein